MCINNLNDGHLVEILDRLYIASSFLDGFILDHPVITLLPKFQESLTESCDKLAELYQTIGQFETISELLASIDPESAKINEEKK